MGSFGAFYSHEPPVRCVSVGLYPQRTSRAQSGRRTRGVFREDGAGAEGRGAGGHGTTDGTRICTDDVGAGAARMELLMGADGRRWGIGKADLRFEI